MPEIIFKNILKEFETFIQSQKPSSTQAMKKACELIDQNLDYYNWTGFYMVSQTEERMLELGPYVGSKTEHTKIPFGKGICGQTAESQDTFIIDDVNQEDNYIACNIDVKSEIVVPMFLEEDMIGQIDIDSNKPAAFGKTDEIFLSQICLLISQVIKNEKNV